MTVIAPAKLILSGEHAVVHGHPALGLALNYYTQVSIEPSVDHFILETASNKKFFSTQDIQAIKKRIEEAYDQFLQGHCLIQSVLHNEDDLLLLTMSLLLQSPLHIRVNSNIPMGCGMGSSASVIVSLLYAMNVHYELALPKEKIFSLAHHAENKQHGRASGFDLHVVLNGGGIYFHHQKIESRQINPHSLWLVHTGVPKTTTGMAVMQTIPFFKNSTLGTDFASVTTLLDRAFKENNITLIKESIRLNHALLKSLKVVPEKVSQFIEAIEARGGAAKICGAGATAGDQAGIVLVLLEESATLESLCEDYHYSCSPLQIDSKGVRSV